MTELKELTNNQETQYLDKDKMETVDTWDM